MLIPTPLATLWHSFCQTHSPWKVEFLSSIFVLLFGFWIPSTLYLLIDILFPAFAAKHKIQKGSRNQMTHAQVRACILFCFQISLGDMAGACLLGYVTRWSPTYTVTGTLPGATEMTWQWIYALLAHEVLVYYVHRTMHHPRLYSCIHKRHHAYSAPIAFVFLYSSPIEHIFAGIIPDVVPLAILNHFYQPVHVLTGVGFLLITLLIGTAEHSGFDFSHPFSAREHDEHHVKPTVNFSSLGFMDWIHGTNSIGRNRPVELKGGLETASIKSSGLRNANGSMAAGLGNLVAS